MSKGERTKRPSSSCIVEDTEREAGNGFKEKKKKRGKCCHAMSRSPFAVFEGRGGGGV